MTRASRYGVLTAVVGLLAACGGPGAKLADKTVFDPAIMEAEIRAAYEGHVVGFSYAINQGGQLARSGAWGLARRPVDGPAAMTPDTRQHLASVSKTVNAVFFLQAARRIEAALGYPYVELESPVAPWLPDGWVAGPGFTGANPLTFRQLLTHTSGFEQIFDGLTDAQKQPWGNDWSGLEYVVGLGALPGSARDYKNANHALFRVLIPRLFQKAGWPIASVDENTAGALYVAMLNEQVLQPVGISRVACAFSSADDYALAYDFEEPAEPGYAAGLGLADCGGHAGLYMSALELARLLAYVRHSDAVLDGAARELMAAGALGWYDRVEAGLPETARLRKAGDWYVYYAGKAAHPEKRKDQHNCVIWYPRGVEAVLLVNSSIGDGQPRPCTLLDQAYEAALVAP